MIGNPRLRVYIAGRYGRREELLGVASMLEKHDVVVTSRWLTGGHDGMPSKQCAEDDAHDIDAAGGLLFFAETPDAGYMSGGRHWECGYAWAKGKWIWIVGEPENVFAHLSRVTVYPNLSAWMMHMELV